MNKEQVHKELDTNEPKHHVSDLRGFKELFDVSLHGTILDRHTSYKKAIAHFRKVTDNSVKLIKYIVATGQRIPILERVAS